MKSDATRFFVCPSCLGDLRLHASESGEITEGELECTSCGERYPVVRGVPRFVRGEEYAESFGKEWNRWPQQQHDSHNGTTIFRDRMLRYSGWTPESMAGKVVIEAGCGPGAFIDVIEDHAEAVIGFDLSSAVDACYRLHRDHPRVYLAQGDIFHPPIRRGVADRLYTFGVVHHTPDPEHAFRSLIPLVRDGGEIAVWVYRKQPLPHPRRLLRLLTVGMPDARATRFLESYVPAALALSGALRFVPVVGRQLSRLVPVADYRGLLPLPDDRLLDWSMMDTYELLFAPHVYPQRWSDLRRWMRDLSDVRRASPREVAAVGVKPAHWSSNGGRAT